MRLESSCTVVVLNWNRPDLTIRSVHALIADGVPPQRIVVVDNGSTDGSAGVLRRELEDTRVVELRENVGFARGNNRGAAEIEGDAYLFVNSDAFVHRRGSVARLLYALTRPGVGIAVPRLRNEDLSLQRSVVPLPTPANAFVRATGLSRLVPDRSQPHWGTHWSHSHSRKVEAANGAVIAVEGRLWASLGGFADWTWMYSDDLDLCWRAAKRGFATWFEADAEFVHLANASGRSLFTLEQRAERVAESDAEMIRRELGRVRAVCTLWLLGLGLQARGLAFAAVRNDRRAREARAAARGYRGAARAVGQAPPRL